MTARGGADRSAGLGMSFMCPSSPVAARESPRAVVHGVGAGVVAGGWAAWRGGRDGRGGGRDAAGHAGAGRRGDRRRSDFGRRCSRRNAGTDRDLDDADRCGRRRPGRGWGTGPQRPWPPAPPRGRAGSGPTRAPGWRPPRCRLRSTVKPRPVSASRDSRWPDLDCRWHSARRRWCRPAGLRPGVGAPQVPGERGGGGCRRSNGHSHQPWASPVAPEPGPQDQQDEDEERDRLPPCPSWSASAPHAVSPGTEPRPLRSSRCRRPPRRPAGRRTPAPRPRRRRPRSSKRDPWPRAPRPRSSRTSTRACRIGR